MSLPVLMRAAAPRLLTLAKSSSEVVSRIAVRLNRPGATAKELLDLAKNNKLVTATILYELYGAGDSLVQKFMAAEPDLESVFDAFKFKDDKPNLENEQEGSAIDDELDLIAAAVRQVGGFDRLMTLKRALDQPYEMYAIYRRRALQGRALSL